MENLICVLSSLFSFTYSRFSSLCFNMPITSKGTYIIDYINYNVHFIIFLNNDYEFIGIYHIRNGCSIPCYEYLSDQTNQNSSSKSKVWSSKAFQAL